MTFRKRILSSVMCLCLLYTAVPLRAKAAAAGSTQADERVSGASITAWKTGATSCDTLWYGIFYESYRNCFTDMTDRGPENMFTKDSGLAYSWNATVAPGEIWTRCVLIGKGSNNEMAIEAPVTPEPEVVVPDPSIELVSNEVYYTEEETLPEQAEWRGLRFVKSYNGNLTVTGIPSDSNTIGVSFLYNLLFKSRADNS